MGCLPRWFWVLFLTCAIAPPSSLAADPPVENALAFEDVFAVSTQPKVIVSVSVTNTKPLAQLSFGLDYDDDMLRLVEILPAENEIGRSLAADGIQTQILDDVTWVTASFIDRVQPAAGSHFLDLLFEISELIPMPADWPVVAIRVGARDAADEKPLFVLEEPNLARTFAQPIVSPGIVRIFTADAIELEGATATPDTDVVSVSILLSNLYPGSVLRMGLDYDDDLLEVRDVGPGPALDGFSGLWIDWVAEDGRLDIECDLGRDCLPAGSHQKILEVEVAVKEGRFEPSLTIPIHVVTGEGATSFQLRAITHGKGTAIETLPRIFLRGDVDMNGTIDIVDVLDLLRSLFGTQRVRCPKSADADDSGALTLGDVVRILGSLYGGAPPPPPPYPSAGQDPTPDALPCP